MIVPAIDLANAAPEIAREMRVASCDTGVFFVRNHGVSESLITAHFALARSFFALELEEKLAIDVRRWNCFRGYEPIGTRTLDEAAPGDWKEGFIMGPDLAPDHPHVLAGHPNTGTNRWPQRPPGFRRQMESYVAAMNKLGRRVAGFLALSLDLPEGAFARALTDPLTYSQLFHYPPMPVALAGQRLGAGAHSDWGMLTILLQDDVGGLEILTRDARWHPAAPVPGTFAIILGEMMVRLTGGRYWAATHRVSRNTSGRSRYSMPTFFDPAYDERIACVPTCRPPSGEPPYPECTVSEHMREMARVKFSAG